MTVRTSVTRLLDPFVEQTRQDPLEGEPPVAEGGAWWPPRSST